MLLGFGAQIGKIDVSILQAGDGDYPKPSHVCARRVRAVSRGRYEANIAMGFVARRVILADGQQTCVLALRSGIWLQ